MKNQSQLIKYTSDTAMRHKESTTELLNKRENLNSQKSRIRHISMTTVFPSQQISG